MVYGPGLSGSFGESVCPSGESVGPSGWSVGPSGGYVSHWAFSSCWSVQVGPRVCQWGHQVSQWALCSGCTECPTFLLFLLNGYFSYFCPTFRGFVLLFSLRNAPKMSKSTFMLQFAIKKSKTNSAARRGAIKMRLGWAAAPRNYQKFLPFLFDSYFFQKFLLNSY